MIEKPAPSLSNTSSHCDRCGEDHPASYLREAGTVKYVIECPARPTETVVSGDDRIFSTVRWSPGNGHGALPPKARRWQFFQVAVTDRCEAECPLCYADADHRGREFLSADEFRERAIRIRQYGGIRISLTGGEPTSHPGLPELIRIARHECGLNPTLVTNGLRIANDPGCLPALKAAGLHRVQLQFDTLDHETYALLRGRRDCNEKILAAERVVAAGMKLGLICTVSDRNLDEAPRLLEFATTLAPGLRTLVFQPMVMVGRMPEGIRTVTAEDVIGVLTGSSRTCDLEVTDFVPFPALANGHVVHPGCSVHALLCTEHGRTRVIRRGADSPGKRRPGTLFAQGILDSLRRRGTSRERRHAFAVSLLSFMSRATRDEQRMERCIVATLANGSFAGLCEHGCGSRPFGE